MNREQEIKREYKQTVEIILHEMSGRIEDKNCNMPAFNFQRSCIIENCDKSVNKILELEQSVQTLNDKLLKCSFLIADITEQNNSLRCCGNCINYSLGKCFIKDHSPEEALGSYFCDNWIKG